EAGAAFGVSPGSAEALLGHVVRSGLPFLPGTMTPTDVMRALGSGFDAMKLFPAAQAGGIGMLKALHGPLPQARFCPTGGIDATNAREFLALPNVGCVGGSWLAPANRIAAKDWPAIEQLAREAAALR
ncbi:MAG TPA: keto-deoxy-phosphogluconate aldolase, partial [Usitatibacteraceae bacterium]|nr:keto-deoxy-phosphogluconate aldolase [Usitatibacteraceae bacterium]